jgi:hypothetical protein
MIGIDAQVADIRIETISPENALPTEERVHQDPGERGSIADLFARL